MAERRKREGEAEGWGEGGGMKEMIAGSAARGRGVRKGDARNEVKKKCT